MGGLCLYPSHPEDFMFLLAYLNTKIAEMQLNVINPTMSFPPGTVNALGCQPNEQHKDEITSLASQCVEFAKDNWDATELSWNFTKSPLV